MTDVRRERQYRLIDVDALAVPGEDPVHDKGVAQVVNPRGVVGAAVAPAELGSQAGEHAIDLARAQLLAAAPASRAHKEGTIFRGRNPAVARAPIPTQRLDRA